MKIKQVQNGEWKVVWPKEFAAPGATLAGQVSRVGRRMSLPSFNLLAAVDPVGHLHRWPVRTDRAGARVDLGTAAPDQPGALRAGVPRAPTSATTWPPCGASIRCSRCWSSRRCSSSSASACSGCWRASPYPPFNSLLVTFGIAVVMESAHPGRLERGLPPPGVALQRSSSSPSARSTCRCPNW